MLLDQLTNAFPTFRFVVWVAATPAGVFTECTVPNVEWTPEEVKEGGLNTYTHQLLGRRGKTNFTLKNGVGTSTLITWYMQIMMEQFEVLGVNTLRRPVTILLLSSLKIPIMTWHIDNALPIKWTGPQLNTSQNSIAVQTLEFVGGEVIVVPGASL